MGSRWLSAAAGELASLLSLEVGLARMKRLSVERASERSFGWLCARNCRSLGTSTSSGCPGSASSHCGLSSQIFWIVLRAPWKRKQLLNQLCVVGCAVNHRHEWNTHLDRAVIARVEQRAKSGKELWPGRNEGEWHAVRRRGFGSTGNKRCHQDSGRGSNKRRGISDALETSSSNVGNTFSRQAIIMKFDRVLKNESTQRACRFS